MNYTFSAPVTAAQRQRDTLLGALVGLARSTVNEPKTEDTDRILAAGLRLAAAPEAAESALDVEALVQEAIQGIERISLDHE